MSWLACISLFALVFPAPAGAVTFGELYTVTVEPDASLGGQQQRNDAIRRGMIELLTRITGRRRTASDPNLAALISNAADYYNVYTPLAGEIRISFLRSQVNEELARLNEPIWPDERPLTLLWLAIDFGDGQRTELGLPAAPAGYRPAVTDAQSAEPLQADARQVFETAVDELLDVADERGLPLVLPRLDAEDRRNVRFADVWGGFDPLVQRVADRYGADAVLIARLGMSAAGPELRWTLRRGDSVEEFASGDLRNGIDRLADQFASEFTIVGERGETWLRIQQIHTHRDYGRVDEYLRSLSVVDDVFIRSWSTNGELLVRIDARADASQLGQILALDGVLAPAAAVDDAAATAVAAPNALVLSPRWLGGGAPVPGLP